MSQAPQLTPNSTGNTMFPLKLLTYNVRLAVQEIGLQFRRHQAAKK
jgi:hypothetical protein